MNLVLRVVSGAVLLGVVTAVLWFGLPWLAIAIGLTAALALWEYDGLARRAGMPAARVVLYPLGLWLAIRPALPEPYRPVEWPLLAAVTVGLLVTALWERSVSGWAAALAGAVLAGFSLGFFIALYELPPQTGAHLGIRLVAVPLAAVFAGDTAAYAAGSTLGRHPFFARISPKKTVEGAVGGAVASIVVALLLGPPLAGIAAWQAALLGAVVAVAAQGGDLAESALKRRAGVKDSSRLIPGHGGLLDRLDSLLVVGPAVYCLMRLLAL